MKQTAIFQFSTLAAVALLTACSGGTGNNSAAKAGSNSESVAPAVTIDDNNKMMVASSSAGAIEQSTDGAMFELADTAGVASVSKEQIASKQTLRATETLDCDSGSGSFTETNTQVSGTFNNCITSITEGGDSLTLSLDGGFTFIEDGSNFSAQFDALTYGFVSEFEGQRSEFGFIFFGSVEGTDDGSTQTISFDNYGLNFYAEVDGQENAEGHFRYHTGTVVNNYGATPETLDVDNLQFSTTFAGVDENDNNVTVDRYSVTMNTTETLVYGNGSNTAPTEGVIVISGSNEMTIDFGTGNPATADLTLNGITEEVQVAEIGF